MSSNNRLYEQTIDILIYDFMNKYQSLKTNGIDKEKINDYIKPEGRKLYLSKPKLRTILHNIVVINSKIFIEKGYDNYEPRNNYNITFIDICNFIEECVIILVNKQKQLI